MSKIINLNLPLNTESINNLHSGDEVFLTGILYTARDAAHQKLAELLKNNQPLPINLQNQTIYYVGPTPAPKGRPIGSAGPTTSDRMDKFTPLLLDNGLKGMIGKGHRSREVKESIVKNKAVYFAAIGGAGALLSKAIKSAKIVAYPELGTEAIRELTVADFPAVVINDIYGSDLYTQRQELK